MASFKHIRHVTISDRGHGDHGPPEAVGNGLEVGMRRTGLREINCTWKENHACEIKSQTFKSNPQPPSIFKKHQNTLKESLIQKKFFN